MARQGIPILTLTLIATSVIATRRFVTPSGAQAGAGVNTMGVSDCEGAIGEALPVHAIGTAIVEAGGAITAGALVEADAEGRAITKNSGVSIARALDAASAEGDFIEVLLIPN